MSQCRICLGDMPLNRKGWHQVCPECRRNGHRELIMTNEELSKEEED